MVTKQKPAKPMLGFCSYSHKDEALKKQLLTHLAGLERAGIISNWHDRKITAGSDLATEIDSNLRKAKVILLLISANFIESNYCIGIEMEKALAKHARGTARVIPVILKECLWDTLPIRRLQALPTDGKPVTKWTNRDAAFTNVARGIRAAIEEMTAPTARRRVPNITKAAPTSGGTTNSPPTATTPRPPVKTRKPTPATPSGSSASSTAAEKASRTRTGRARIVTPTNRISHFTSPEKSPAAIQWRAMSEVASPLNAAFADRPRSQSGHTWLQVAWASLREDAAVNPTSFIDDKFVSDVQRIGYGGKIPLFPYGASNIPDVNTERLQIVQNHSINGGRCGQDNVIVTLYANGVLSVTLNVTGLAGYDMHNWSGMQRINPDDVQKRLAQAWDFAVRWHRFGSASVSADKIAYNAGILDPSYYPFERPPQTPSNSMTLSSAERPNPIMVYKEPRLISGPILTKPTGEIEDVIKMFQMRFAEFERGR